MRLCFVDFAPWDYNVATPTVRPLGGSQSAMCYLAVELAKLGHKVTVTTHTSESCVIDGVECLGPRDTIRDYGFDAVIALNAPGHVADLRGFIPSSTRLILWTQHAVNQPVMRKLAKPETRNAWDAFVFVSDWQRCEAIDRLGVDPSRSVVLRNAIAPAFENLFASHADLVEAKSGDVLRLAYTSTPYRGLKLLPDIFRPYRGLNPDAALEVYSSMAVYMEDADKDRKQFGAIYDALGSLDGVEICGSLPQPDLAKRLRSAHILAYPNAFPETSCIAVMEALASGMRVVTSDLGALRETCEGFALLVPVGVDIDDAATTITVRDGDGYSAAFLRALAKATYTTAGLYDQVVHMNENHTWAVRARQWSEFLNAA